MQVHSIPVLDLVISVLLCEAGVDIALPQQRKRLYRWALTVAFLMLLKSSM